jgi:hypothetical protein
MELWEKIIEVYPELAEDNFAAFSKQIILQNDSDGQGAYIAKWDYDRPMPEGFKLGK